MPRCALPCFPEGRRATVSGYGPLSRPGPRLPATTATPGAMTGSAPACRRGACRITGRRGRTPGILLFANAPVRCPGPRPARAVPHGEKSL